MTLKPEEVFEAWAPEESPWSAWAKPVLFAHAVFPGTRPRPALPDLGVLQGLDRTAVIVDVEGVQSILIGLALAEAGYRPVPLYNSGLAAGAIVDLRPIADELGRGAERLRELRLPPDAPPAFLMNADRMNHPRSALSPGSYDNRWRLLPQDMPSANRLQQAGIARVVLVSKRVEEDLAHILHRYQQGKIELLAAAGLDRRLEPLQVAKPVGFRSLIYLLFVFAGLRRNSAGGFGGVVPSDGAMGVSG